MERQVRAGRGGQVAGTGGTKECSTPTGLFAGWKAAMADLKIRYYFHSTVQMWWEGGTEGWVMVRNR